MRKFGLCGQRFKYSEDVACITSGNAMETANIIETYTLY